MRGWGTSVLLVCVLLAGCDDAPLRDSRPPLPDGRAGRVLGRAIEAAGGWERWQSARDVAYVSTLTLLNPVGLVASQSIGWFMAPLHQGMRARMESIGLATETVLGVDRADTWMLQDGHPVQRPDRLEVTRFNLVSTYFWFSLPFSLAEMPATVTDLGEKQDAEGNRWHLLKFVFDEPNHAVPGKWFIIYFDHHTGLIDRIHAHLAASFLNHDLWLGKLIDYRDWNGFRIERRRKFFPADLQGEIIDNMVAEQLVEYVRFDNGFAADHFDRPAILDGGRLARVPVPRSSGLGAQERRREMEFPPDVESSESNLPVNLLASRFLLLTPVF